MVIDAPTEERFIALLFVLAKEALVAPEALFTNPPFLMLLAVATFSAYVIP
jgi:hypothetical protein